jgi:hypothetical protein
VEPITIAILAAIFGGAATVTLLKWSAIRRKIDVSKIPGGFAEVINKGLKGDHYEVDLGIFDRGGTRRKSKTWKAKNLDSELQSRFSQAGGAIRVQT